jgi:hypothetical protein
MPPEHIGLSVQVDRSRAKKIPGANRCVQSSCRGTRKHISRLLANEATIVAVFALEAVHSFDVVLIQQEFTQARVAICKWPGAPITWRIAARIAMPHGGAVRITMGINSDTFNRLVICPRIVEHSAAWDTLRRIVAAGPV